MADMSELFYTENCIELKIIKGLLFSKNSATLVYWLVLQLILIYLNGTKLQYQTHP